MAPSALSFGVRHDFRQILPQTMPYADYYEECIREVKRAEELGATAAWVTDHHFWNDGYLPSSFGMLAALARETKTMTLGSSVILLPLYHPLRVAEDGAFVDLISGGRFILGVGLGYVKHEFEILEADRSKRGKLMDEGIAIIKQAWETGRVTFHGERWNFDDVIVNPRPVQQPRPPMYMGGSSVPAMERVAREADGYWDPGGPTIVEQVQNRYAMLRAALERRGRSGEGFPFELGPSLVVDEDSDRAWQIAAPAIAFQSNQYLQYGTDPDKPRPPDVTPASLKQEDFLVGTPDMVLERLQRLYDAVPYTRVNIWGRLPGLTHEQATRSLELFAERVMPRLSAYAQGMR